MSPEITAFKYHGDTGYERNKIGGHPLDWRNQPDVYKNYPGQDYVPLPENRSMERKRLSEILKGNEKNHSGRSLNIDELSLILQLTYGITAKAIHSGEPFFYRSAASAGALYPIEIYTANKRDDRS